MAMIVINIVSRFKAECIIDLSPAEAFNLVAISGSSNTKLQKPVQVSLLWAILLLLILLLL